MHKAIHFVPLIYFYFLSYFCVCNFNTVEIQQMITELAGLMANDSSIFKTWVLTVSHEAGVEVGKAETIWLVPKERQMCLT